MATVFLSPVLNGWQSLLASGAPNALGFVYVYQAGTTTPKVSYTSSAGNVATANPIPLGVSGVLPYELWLVQGGAYKFVITDAALNQVGITLDNISGVNDIGAGPSISNPTITGTITGGNMSLDSSGNLAINGTNLQIGPQGGVASYFRARVWSNYYTDFGSDTSYAGYINTVSNGTYGATEIRRNGTLTFRFNDDGRVWGTALHNNAGAVTGTTNQYIASGTYSPTLTDISNTASATNVGTANWIRVGNVVTVSGSMLVTATATSTTTQTRITLPIASTLNSGTGDAAGTACPAGGNTAAFGTAGSIQASSTTVYLTFVSGSTGSFTATMQYTFTYVIR